MLAGVELVSPATEITTKELSKVVGVAESVGDDSVPRQATESCRLRVARAKRVGSTRLIGSLTDATPPTGMIRRKRLCKAYPSAHQPWEEERTEPKQPKSPRLAVERHETRRNEGTNKGDEAISSFVVISAMTVSKGSSGFSVTALSRWRSCKVTCWHLYEEIRLPEK